MGIKSLNDFSPSRNDADRKGSGLSLVHCDNRDLTQRSGETRHQVRKKRHWVPITLLMSPKMRLVEQRRSPAKDREASSPVFFWIRRQFVHLRSGDWKILTDSALLFGGSAIRLGATSDKVLTPKTRGVRSDTNLAHAPRVSSASREDADSVAKISPECRLETMKELRRPSHYGTLTPPLASLPPTDFSTRVSAQAAKLAAAGGSALNLQHLVVAYQTAIEKERRYCRY